MTQSEIKKLQWTKPVQVEELPNLAQEAQEVLGYAQRKVETVLSEPRATLAKLEIEILDPKDVMTYQLLQKQERERELLKRWWASHDEPPDRLDVPVVNWATTAIGQYKGWIPDHVLAKAIEIKKANPELGMWVTHLEETSDPFLLVAPAGTSEWRLMQKGAWVECWMEPGFERGL